jgi:hypothetical protein
MALPPHTTPCGPFREVGIAAIGSTRGSPIFSDGTQGWSAGPQAQGRQDFSEGRRENRCQDGQQDLEQAYAWGFAQDGPPGIGYAGGPLSRYTELTAEQKMLVQQLNLDLPPQPPPRITAPEKTAPAPANAV